VEEGFLEGADVNGWWMVEAGVDTQLGEDRRELADAFGWSGIE
jgi:hypothetical protein